MKVYKSIRPFIIENPKAQFGKNQIFVVLNDKVHVQGRANSLKYEVFLTVMSMGVLEETKVSDEFIRENIILTEEYQNIKKVLVNAKKKLPQYSKIFKTIGTWAFSPKGSSASKIEEETVFQSNPEKVLESTVLRDGMKAKPGDAVMNRGTLRHGPYVTEEEEEMWANDDTTILPYGIRKDDYASQSEQVKIFTKLIGQVCSMEDCPQDFKDFFKNEMGVVSKNEPLRDYLPSIDRKTRKSLGYSKLYFKDFDKNQHHSKENGLEFCHIDPWQDFPTNVDNITIGSSEANRRQGGYPLDVLKESFS